MMLRYVLKLGRDISQQDADQMLARLKEAVDTATWRDGILGPDVDIIDMRARSAFTPAQIRLARARLR